MTAEFLVVAWMSENLHDIDNPRGRAWFHFEDGKKIRYDGMNGFLVRETGHDDQYFSLRELTRQTKF